MTSDDTKPYKAGALYIVDDIDTAAPRRSIMGRERPDMHHFNCTAVRCLFQKYTTYDIHSVRFPPGTTEATYLRYWEQELAKYTEDDLIVIYYHGNAGGEDGDYGW